MILDILAPSLVLFGFYLLYRNISKAQKKAKILPTDYQGEKILVTSLANVGNGHCSYCMAWQVEQGVLFGTESDIIFQPVSGEEEVIVLADIQSVKVRNFFFFAKIICIKTLDAEYTVCGFSDPTKPYSMKGYRTALNAWLKFLGEHTINLTEQISQTPK